MSSLLGSEHILPSKNPSEEMDGNVMYNQEYIMGQSQFMTILYTLDNSTRNYYCNLIGTEQVTICDSHLQFIFISACIIIYYCQATSQSNQYPRKTVLSAPLAFRSPLNFRHLQHPHFAEDKTPPKQCLTSTQNSATLTFTSLSYSSVFSGLNLQTEPMLNTLPLHLLAHIVISLPFL